jgi:hypothetical protein
MTKVYCLIRLSRFILICSLVVSFNLAKAQVDEDFSDGDFSVNPQWFGDTADFKISNSSAIPPEMKPALQLDGLESDTSFIYLPNNLMSNTEWNIWIKLSFNTSANNFARIYLASDQENLENDLNGYFLQVGGSNDSIMLFRQTNQNIDTVHVCENAYTGNSTNVFRLKIQRDETGNWNLFSDPTGGYNFINEGSAFDDTFAATGFFGLYCKYTTSNATKFYFDDILVQELSIDTIPPDVDTLVVVSLNEMNLHFSENVELTSAQDIQNYFVSNGIGIPTDALRDLNNFSQVQLIFDESFNPGESYSLTVSNVQDLSGNIMETDTLDFVISSYSTAAPFDILISEIMADVNPPPIGLPEADYLELYNRTAEPVNLQNFLLKPRESSDFLVFPNAVIEPDSFLILVSTADVEDFEPYGTVIGLPGFSLNNEGFVVLRDPDGKWIHAVDYTLEFYGDENKQEGGWSIEMVDPLHPCIYTIENWAASINESGGTPGSRNSTLDTLFRTPEIISIETLSKDIVKIEFSQLMDSSYLVNKNAYEIDQGIGYPDSVVTGELFFNFVYLFLSEDMEENKVYQLTITDTILNCSGEFIEINSNYPVILPVEAQPYDVVINEILADPDPPVGLPEYEFIEILNISDSFIRIKDWKLVVGTTEKAIPDFVIDPGQYVIFTQQDAALLYGLFGRSVGFGSLGLTNSGTTLKLIDQNGRIISSVAYKDNWYGDEEKSEGGWSLEQIDPLNPCAGKNNWTVSLAEEGGTPGGINSVYAENQLEPEVDRVIPVEENVLEVYFTQSMERETIIDRENYSVDFGFGNPSATFLTDSLYTSVTLEFDGNFQKGTIYTLELKNTLVNCVGIPLEMDGDFPFGLPEIPSKNDMVINEVLFNPAGDGVDFVEIYNRSGKIFDMKYLYLGSVSINQYEPNDTNFKSVSEVNRLLLTESYIVLSSDPGIVQEQYFSSDPDAFIQMGNFPTYNNESGTVILSNQNGSIIDAFNYHEDMHHPLLNSVEGVSLERINYNRPAQDATNWHSASAEVGYATPGYQNSQFVDDAEIFEEVTVEPEIFSPDNDGRDDVVNIRYDFSSAGFSASITIYDSQGRLVRQLVNNALLGASGAFSWDGRTDDDQKANIGIYIIYFEAFNTAGSVKKYKKAAVLAGKL